MFTYESTLEIASLGMEISVTYGFDADGDIREIVTAGGTNLLDYIDNEQYTEIVPQIDAVNGLLVHSMMDDAAYDAAAGF
jgi:hypothetical protein